MRKIFHKKFIFLIIGFVLVFVVFVFGRKLFFRKEAKRELLPFSRIEIDFSILESEEIEKLKPFKEIPPFEDEIGRENPFLPYSKAE